MTVRELAQLKTHDSATHSPVFCRKPSGKSLRQEPADEARDVSDRGCGHNFGDVQAVSPFFKQSCTPTIQAKLKIGQPNDKFEQEADRVVEQVMRMPEPQVQRKACLSCNDIDEEEQIQAKPIAGTITRLIQREVEWEEQEEEEEDDESISFQAKEVPGQTPGVAGDVKKNIDNLRGTGKPLSKSERSYFVPRFGVDFSHVHVHTGSKASELSKSINAKAFTLGNDIVFRDGEHSPATSKGRHLFAHELTHVIQQGKSRGKNLKNPGVIGGTTISSHNSQVIQRKNGRSSKKLDAHMAKYANEELWARHPELKKRKLTSDKADAELRKEWRRYYRWGKALLSKGNCFRFTVDDPVDPAKAGQKHSPFPGGPDPGGHISCTQIMDGAKKLGAADVTKDKPCPKGYRKIAGVIQDKSAPAWNDYHWYRQESNGFWTHKRGRHSVEDKDAYGKQISDPATANRKYAGSKDYDRFCGYLCIPRNVDIDKTP